MKFEVKPDDGYWSLYIDGVKHIDRESYTVVDQVAHYLRNPDIIDSECWELAQVIRSNYMGG